VDYYLITPDGNVTAGQQFNTQIGIDFYGGGITAANVASAEINFLDSNGDLVGSASPITIGTGGVNYDMIVSGFYTFPTGMPYPLRYTIEVILYDSDDEEIGAYEFTITVVAGT
jgi:hypothetical protein